LKQDKYFAPVGRIDGAAGDRNLVCSCPPLEAFEENTAAFEENTAGAEN
jgi:glycine dehydrogenase